jgi:hypothetical protein
MRRRIVIIGIALTAMFAAPIGLGAANAGPSLDASNKTVACLGNGNLLGMSICIPMPKL